MGLSSFFRRHLGPYHLLPLCRNPAASGSTLAGSCVPGPDQSRSGPGSHFVLSKTAARGAATLRFRRLIALNEDIAVAVIAFAAIYVALVVLGAAERANLL